MKRVDDISGVILRRPPVGTQEFRGRGWNFQETDRSGGVREGIADLRQSRIRYILPPQKKTRRRCGPCEYSLSPSFLSTTTSTSEDPCGDELEGGVTAPPGACARDLLSVLTTRLRLTSLRPMLVAFFLCRRNLDRFPAYSLSDAASEAASVSLNMSD